MRWVIYLFGSGLVFFLGVGFILVGLVTFIHCRRQPLKALASLCVILGLLLVGASATPLPYWMYGIAVTITFVWLVAERLAHGWLLARQKLFRGVVVVVWASALLMELPYHYWPTTLAANGNPKLYILGDSVASGLDGEKQTWPRLLADSHSVEVVDLSKMGATAASALRQAEGLPVEGGLVLLEIGGNDLLGSTSAVDFERNLARLLDRVYGPGRVVLMFELPLPPFCNEFGRAQRQLASEYGVVLIPKRVFADVLTGEGATLDSVHLDRQGHERMAEVVWSWIEPAYREAP
jgi:acyl-CoA thioesterase-1